MTRLDISENSIRASGCKALVGALAGNQVMRELNVASNQLTLKSDAQSFSDVDMSGVTALADVISGMGAMSKFTFSGDFSDSKPVTMTTTMTEADFSGKALGVSGSMMVAAFLPKCQ